MEHGFCPIPIFSKDEIANTHFANSSLEEWHSGFVPPKTVCSLIVTVLEQGVLGLICSVTREILDYS